MRKVDLFQPVNRNDRDDLIAKAYEATRWIKLLAVIALLLSIVAFLLFLLGINIISRMDKSYLGLKVFGIMDGPFVFLMLSILMQTLVFIYIKILRHSLEDDEIPNLFFAYILLLLTIASSVFFIFPDPDFVGLILIGSTAFLWLLIVTSLERAKRL